MKISNSLFISKTNFNSNIKNKNIKKENPNYVSKNYDMPNYKSYFIPFTGGKSLNLKETVNMLEEYQFPPDIYETAQEVLANGNPENKRLYDIHFDKYKGVNDCFSLEELKEKYPEFKDVISSDDAEVEKGVIYDFQNHESKYFDNDEDLTLQLIKLYWGKGLSFHDLKKYTADISENNEGVSLFRVFNKLNIPVLNQTYAQYLKLSNEEYNLEITNRMSQLLREQCDKKAQELDGEPVYLPRTPLTKEHRKHISEGLKKYYLEHPEKLYEQSKRQKEFLQENPIFAEKFSIALEVAWNTQEGKSIRKSITKFAKKQAVISEDAMVLKKSLSENERKILSKFWEKNPWAREKFSSALKRGWEYAQDAPEIYNKEVNNEHRITLHLLPDDIAKEIRVWEKTNAKEQLRAGCRYGSIHKNDDDILAENPKHKKLYTELLIENKNTIDYFSKRPALLQKYLKVLEQTLEDVFGTHDNYKIIPNENDTQLRLMKVLAHVYKMSKSQANYMEYDNSLTQHGNNMKNLLYYSQFLNVLSFDLMEEFGEKTHYVTEFFNKRLEKNYNNFAQL